MNYLIHYSCISHVGKCRAMNQDNFICGGRYLEAGGQQADTPLTGHLQSGQPAILGVFDGMGGEERGEMASFLAAQCAAKVQLGQQPLEDLLAFCKEANEAICSYAAQHEILSMGTTAAVLGFTKSEISLCNIGDSKVFRYAEGQLTQISTDHYAVAVHGRKPPLSQNLGIPPSEMIIEPYIARGRYQEDDVYLICSDGLTDMVTTEQIAQILLESTLQQAPGRLLDAALQNGGKDNITMILCQLEREKWSPLRRLFQQKNKRKGEQQYGN